MTEFEFLKHMFHRLQAAQHMDTVLKTHIPKCADKAASSGIEETIRDYLEMRRSQS